MRWALPSEWKSKLWEVKGGKRTEIGAEAVVEALASPTVQLRVQAKDGKAYSFSWSADGQSWKELQPSNSLDGSFLPPWDRGVRIALVAKGAPEAAAVFDWFRVTTN